MKIDVFQQGGSTVSASSTAPTASNATAIGGPSGEKQVVVTSPAGNALAYITFGASNVAATSAGYPVLGGSQFPLTTTFDYFSILSASGAVTLYVTPGNGA